MILYIYIYRERERERKRERECVREKEEDRKSNSKYLEEFTTHNGMETERKIVEYRILYILKETFWVFWEVVTANTKYMDRWISDQAPIYSSGCMCIFVWLRESSSVWLYLCFFFVFVFWVAIFVFMLFVYDCVFCECVCVFMYVYVCDISDVYASFSIYLWVNTSVCVYLGIPMFLSGFVFVRVFPWVCLCVYVWL